jgi:hypothetical protein
MSPQGSSRPAAVAAVAGASRAEAGSSQTQVKMKFNRAGTRIDGPMPWCDPLLFQMFQAASPQPCARFLLTVCTAVACAGDHEPALDLRQKFALQRLARHTPCVNGLRCIDSACVASHQCPWPRCDRLERGQPCTFAVGMHNVDKTVVEVR